MNTPGLDLVEILKHHRPSLFFESFSKPQETGVFVSCMVDNTSFQSVGDNFETAKQEAAQLLLQHLIVSDENVRADKRLQAFLPESPPAAPMTAGDSQKVCQLTNQHMSPLMYFNQISAKDKPEWVLHHVSFRPSSFRAELTVKDQKFEAVNQTKKLAKQNAAKQALLEVYGVGADSLIMPNPPKRKRPHSQSTANPTPLVAEPSDEAPLVPANAFTGPQESTEGMPVDNGTAEVSNEPPAKLQRRSGPASKWRAKSGQKKPGRRGAGNRNGGGIPRFSRGRHPLQVLNEFRRGIEFQVVNMDGPSHAPTITMTAEVDGTPFEAQATSKQRAKMILGLQILTHFEAAGLLQLVSEDAADTQKNPATGPPADKQPMSEECKTPLVRLYDLMPNRPSCDTWEEKEENLFVASFSINGRTFQGRGITQYTAKQAAAAQILKDVFNIDADPKPANPPPVPDDAPLTT